MSGSIGCVRDARWAGIVTILVLISSPVYAFFGFPPLPGEPILPPLPGSSFAPSWIAESNQEYALFGWSAAGAGDVNGDGYGDVIVGAPLYEDAFEQGQEGWAFVYLGTSTGLTPVPVWFAESDLAGEEFGSSVASAGDVNGDGYDDVIVGAHYHTNGEYQEGSASVYLGSPWGLSTAPAWVVESNRPFAYFGESVASAGDVNGDGYGDVIVGARNYGPPYEGGAFVYLGSPSGLSTTPAWSARSGQTGSYFGESVASAGDVNGDGYGDVIVGAYDFTNGQSYEGRAFVYLGSATGLSPVPAWTAESDQARAFFGASVASAGDVDGDGYGDVIVGATGYSNGQVGEGRAFLFLGSAAGLSAAPAWTAESDQAGGAFGGSVATAGDFNGDGYDDVIVGTNWYDNGQTDEGRIFLFLGSASGLAATPALTAESDQIGTMSYGVPAGTAGDVNGDGFADVIVGANRMDNGQYDEGMVFVYNGYPLPGVLPPVNPDADFDGFTALQGDCDEANPSIHPGAAETPDDGVDQDCSGSDSVACFLDADRDGFGSAVPVLAADGSCDAAQSEADVSGDCDDANPTIRPGASETPDDGVDQDCNGFDTVTCFLDADRDGYGTKAGTTVLAADGSCDTAQSEAVCPGDPKDANPSVHPGYAPDHCLRQGADAMKVR